MADEQTQQQPRLETLLDGDIQVFRLTDHFGDETLEVWQSNEMLTPTREQAAALWPLLKAFAESGTLPDAGTAR